MELNIPLSYQKDIETAAKFLKSEGCESVFLFGSMVTGKIHQNSDIDIGIKGLPPGNFFRVYAQLDNNLSNEVDLVDLCKIKEPDYVEKCGVSMILHLFYNGIENVLLLIIKNKDSDLPNGK